MTKAFHPNANGVLDFRPGLGRRTYPGFQVSGSPYPERIVDPFEPSRECLLIGLYAMVVPKSFSIRLKSRLKL